MFDLQELVERARTFTEENPSMEDLGEWVFNQPWGEFDWRSELPALHELEAYSRHIAALDPFEIALLHWKPGAESAVHWHEGFWGYVVCLSGQLEHHGFELRQGVLSQNDRVVAFEGGVLAEPDGTIHRLVNGSSHAPLVTLHVYAPALEDLGGLQLFDLESGDIYTCNASAPAADLSLPDEHYESIVRSAFVQADADADASHTISPVVPKPASPSIRKLLAEYYRAQAKDYDRLDRTDDRRQAYTRGVNACIAERLAQLNAESGVSNVLDVGCGTGRRAMEIRAASGLDYTVYGTDLSPEMAAIAAGRGIHMSDGFWEGEAGLSGLDAVTFLYAFSHIATRAERKAAMDLLYQVLRPGGMLFIDVFNRNDPHEWGPQLMTDFDKWHLGRQGYDAGDVFYSRTGTKELAFLHYTNIENMTHLLNSSGFVDVACTRIGYAHKPGQEVDEGGSLMFFAKRPNDEN